MATISEMAVSIGVDISDFTRDMQRVGDELRNIGSGVQPVDIQINTSHFEQGVHSAESQLNELSGETATPTVTADTTQAETHIEAAADQIAQIDGETATAELMADSTQLNTAVDSAKNKIKEIGEAAKSVGENLSKYLTVPITGLGAAAIFVAGETEGATARIRNSLGLTAEEAENLTGIAKNIYRDGFGESMEEVETALIQTKQNMRSIADEDLSDITTQALVLANTFDSEVNEVTRAGYNMMEAFGLTSREAFDIMAHGAQNGLNFSNELFDNLSEYAPLFGKMGFSAQQYFELLERGSAMGVYNLDYINDVMKEFQIRVKDGSKATSDAMDQLSGSTNKVWKSFLKGEGTVKDVHDAIITELSNMEDQVKANEIGVGMYGTKWEDLESDVMYYLGNVTGELGDLEGTMQGMADIQEETFGQRFQSILRELKASLLPLGETLLDMAEEWLPEISEAAEDVSSWFRDLSPEAKKFMVVAGGIAAVAGPIAVALGTVASGIGGLVTTFGAASGAIAGAGGAASVFGGALAAITGPIGLTVAGLAAVGVGAFKLTQELKKPSIQSEIFAEDISEATRKAVGSFVELNEGATEQLNYLRWSGSTVTKEAADSIKDNFSQMGDQITAGLKEDHAEQLATMQTFFENSMMLTEQEKQAVLAKMDETYAQQQAKVENGEKIINDIIAGALAQNRKLTEEEYIQINNIKEGMLNDGIRILSENEVESRSILERMKADATIISAEQAAEVVKNSKKQKDEVVAEAEKQYDETVQQIIRMRDEAGTITADMANRMIADARKQRDDTVSAATDMHNKVVHQAKLQSKEHVNEVNWETGEILSKWQKLQRDLDVTMNLVATLTKKYWQMATDTVKTQTSSMVSIAKEKMGNVKSNIETAMNGAVSFLKNIDLRSIGANIMQGLLNGIGSKANALRDKAMSIANGIKNALKNALDIHSPSRVMRDEIGKWIPLGIAEGIEGHIGAIRNAANDMSFAATPNVAVATPNISAAAQQEYGARSFTVEVPVNLNGQEIARVTSPYIDDIQGNNYGSRMRVRGLRK
jgi:TP901 family phage tail tape measure protein